MFGKLERRGRDAAERAAARRRDELAARAGEEIPGVAARAEGDHVVLAGRGLHRRMLSDPRLRWIGSLVR